MSDIQQTIKALGDRMGGSTCVKCGWEDIQMRFLPHQPNDDPKNYVIFYCPNCSTRDQIPTASLTTSTSKKATSVQASPAKIASPFKNQF